MVERPHVGGKRKVGGDGEPEVFVADEQNEVVVELTRWQELARSVLLAEGVRGNAEMSLIFVDTDEIAGLNDQFMGKPGPTDVLSFPIDAYEAEVTPVPAVSGSGPTRSPIDPTDMPLLLGDVVVCPAVAQRQAPDHAGTFADELALLVVHGVLHVLGHDHAEPAEREVMQAKERAHLEAFHWHGPAPAAFRQDQADDERGDA